MAQTNPLRLPPHLTDRPPQRLREDLAPGTVIANTVTNKVLVAIFGSRVVRIRALVTAQAGTLKARYVTPEDTTVEYATNQPADVALVAGTENIMEIATVTGEAYLSVQITSGADGMTVSFVDVSQSATS